MNNATTPTWFKKLDNIKRRPVVHLSMDNALSYDGNLPKPEWVEFDARPWDVVVIIGNPVFVPSNKSFTVELEVDKKKTGA